MKNINISRLITTNELLSVIKPTLTAESFGDDFFTALMRKHTTVNALFSPTSAHLRDWGYDSLLLEQALFDEGVLKYEEMVVPSKFYKALGIYDELHLTPRNMQALGKHFRGELCSVYGSGYLVPKTRYKSYGDTFEDSRNEIKLKEYNKQVRLHNTNLKDGEERMTERSTGEQMYTSEFCLYFLKKMIADGTVKMTPSLEAKLKSLVPMTSDLAAQFLDILYNAK